MEEMLAKLLTLSFVEEAGFFSMDGKLLLIKSRKGGIHDDVGIKRAQGNLCAAVISCIQSLRIHRKFSPEGICIDEIIIIGDGDNFLFMKPINNTHGVYMKVEKHTAFLFDNIVRRINEVLASK